MRKHPLARCEDCVFKTAPFVPTQNLHPRSKIAVVGEAPGAYEAGRGIPFTGPSGRLLDQVLLHNGISRDSVMVTNVCLCRPTDNADPPKSAIECCKPRLDAELAASGVEKILAVGGTAASNLIDPKKKITKLRVGGPKPYIGDPNVSVVATWHPAFCLRSPDSFPDFASDTAKLRGASYGEWKEPEYRVFTTPETSSQAIKQLSGLSTPIVVDIETAVEKDDGKFGHPDQNELLCVGISYAKGKSVVFDGPQFQEVELRQQFAKYLRNAKIIGHNGKFDLNGLHPLFGELELWADTMLMSYCLDERPGRHSLEKLGIEILGAPDWKGVVAPFLARGKNYANIPKPILWKYNAFDTAITWDVWEYFTERMSDRERKEHAFLVQASNALMYLERAGITFDLDYSLDLQNLLEKELDQLEVQLSNTTGRNINPRSPMQITRWFAEQGINLSTTQADVLEELKGRIKNDKVITFIDQLLLHRRRAKLNGTYVSGFQNRMYKGKVYTTYTLHGTTSGRLASKNPNMQNIVRDKRIKEQFTVENEDNVLIQLDYKQAEGRVITHLAKDDYLASIFSDPTRDIFNELTEQIYGEGNWGKEERVKIKSVFYGLSYGRGAASIGTELDIPLSEASELLANFKALIPKTVQWQASVTHSVLNGEDLITPFGRKRSFWLITDKNKSDVINEALSFLPQSIASDICLSALIVLQKRLRGLATIRLTIHDALIVECKESNADLVIQIMKEEMIAAGQAFTTFVPFEVDVSIGKKWSDL